MTMTGGEKAALVQAVNADKPEPAQTIVGIDIHDREVIFHLDDGTSRPATEAEVREMDLWDSVRNRRFPKSSKRPLPRHRPPRFKADSQKVAPRLPPDIFGPTRGAR